MKRTLIVFVFLISSLAAFTQVTVRPTCDEAPINIPLSFTYNGFIITDAFSELPPERRQMRFEISEGSAQGNVLYEEEARIQINRSGYFSVELGSQFPEAFHGFLYYMNDNADKTYYIDTYLRDSNGADKYLGSKKLTTVPYAVVANSLGGIGERGEAGISSNVEGSQGRDGQDGQDGVDGQDGPSGLDGVNGFGRLDYLNEEPLDTWRRSWYVDDGTNTADGKPHLRFFDSTNGIWIDL